MFAAEHNENESPNAFYGTIGRFPAVLSMLLGAAVAMSLVAGLGFWLYRLGTQEPQDIPVIRAALDPVKVRPEEPGGMRVAHQNISSYENLDGVKVHQAAEVSVLPNPPEPRPEDIAMGRLAAISSDMASGAARPQADTAPSSKTLEPTPATAQPEAKPAAEATPAPPEAEPSQTEAPSPPDVPAANHAQVPMPPARPADRGAGQVIAAAQRDESEEIKLAARAAASSVQIQLAADPAEAVIRSEWSRIYRANNDILNGRALAVQTTHSGGTLFYRLRVGPFSNRGEASAVCQALRARGQDCIVTDNS